MHPDIDLSTADRDVFISIIARQQAIIEGLRKRVAQLAGRIWPNGSREMPSLNPNNSFIWVRLRTRDFQLLNGSTDERHGLGGVAAQGGGNIGFTGQHEEDDGPVTQGLRDLSGGPSSHLRAVFIQGHIPYPVAAVFVTPLSPPKGEEDFRAGLQERQAGTCIGQLSPGLSSGGDGAFQSAHLGQAWPIGAANQQIGDAQPLFHPATVLAGLGGVGIANRSTRSTSGCAVVNGVPSHLVDSSIALCVSIHWING